ncbi:hypothetical protein BJX66DRAFT_163649 [Aspergillus keveii]|uniref:Muramidase n=1 Tax=Aspergillus keveii TaxID=714993 RepID=A0ABR4GAS9_9EURO
MWASRFARSATRQARIQLPIPGPALFSPRPQLQLLRLSLPLQNKRFEHRSSTAPPQTETTISNPIPELHPKHLYSEASSVLEEVLRSRSKKWGWVVYRCTYDDEATWQKLKQWIIDENRERTEDSDAPTLIDHLDMVFFEDRALFENASRDNLRVHFKAWREDQFSRLGPADQEVIWGARRGESGRITIQHPEINYPRFHQFVQVDDESLQSMVEEWEEPRRLRGTGHVNFVDADWPHDMGDDDEDEYLGLDEATRQLFLECQEEALEPVDGCTGEDVGWMKVAATGLSPHWCLYSDCNEGWQGRYVRPPEILYV